MLPAPAPTSHSSSPGKGASRDRLTARTSRLVSWPSCSKASSGRPGTRANGREPGAATQSTAITCRPLSTPTASVGAPRSDRTTTRLGPYPASSSVSPTTPAVPPSTRTRRPGWRAARRAAGGRPTRLTTSTLSTGQPSRAQASDTDDTCGSTRTRSAPTSRTSVEPIPWNIGSPLASTHTARSGSESSRPGRFGSSGDGSGTRSAPVSGTRASWRALPTTTSAASTARREAGTSPSQPSAPTPTTVITRRPARAWSGSPVPSGPRPTRFT